MCLNALSVSDISSSFSLFCSFLFPSHFHYLPPSTIPHLFLISFQFTLSAFFFSYFSNSSSHFSFSLPTLSFSLSYTNSPLPPSPLTLLWKRESWVGRQQQLQKEQLLSVCVCVYMPQLVPSTRLLGQGWSQQGTTTLPTPHQPACVLIHTERHTHAQTPLYRYYKHMHSHALRNFTRTFIFKYTPIQ